MSRHLERAGHSAYDVAVGELDDSRPTYKRLADDLRTEIRSGRLAGGEQVPSVRKLADQHGVAQMTANQALKELHAEGLIYTVTGRGTYVRQTLPPPDPRSDRLGDLMDRLSRLEERVSALESEG